VKDSLERGIFYNERVKAKLFKKSHLRAFFWHFSAHAPMASANSLCLWPLDL
jgi:hypothetical protein